MPPADGKRSTVLRTLTSWAEQYRDCQARHGRLVQATTDQVKP